MEKNVPKVTVVGCGQWGKNIVRNFAELGALYAVCDADEAVAADFASRFKVPAVSLEAAMTQDCDGIAFASPAALHAEQASRTLRAGKHVFVEKPLALTVEDGRKVRDLAAACGKVLMVGHLLRYNALVMEVLRIVHAGELGTIRHIVSSRLGLGKIRTEEDIIWSFAPHDLSVLLAIAGRQPLSVSAHGSAIVTPGIADVADIHMTFDGGLTAQVNVSWLHPFRERKLSVIGSEGHLVFDDMLEWDRKLVLLPHKVNKKEGAPPQIVQAQPVAVTVPQTEPLREECRHFLEAIGAARPPRTDAAEALRVLAVLEAAGRSIEARAPVAPQLD